MININDKKQIYIDYSGEKIIVSVVYRKRKSITINIRPKNHITIVSPPGVSLKKLEEILIKKSSWIYKKLEEYKELDDIDDINKLEDGKILFYLGNEYKLKIKVSINQDKIYIKDNEIVVEAKNTDQEYILKKLKEWYKKESQKIVENIFENYKKENNIIKNLNISKLVIKEQKKIWGSCTSKGSIYINSKISMARPKSIEYILIHELSHLIHMNHSKDFYKLVQTLMPNYKQEEIWLKEHSYKLKL